MKKIGFLFLLFYVGFVRAQHVNNPIDSNQQLYLHELKDVGGQFTRYFYPQYVDIHKLPEQNFVSKIDSVRKIFNNVLIKYKQSLQREYYAAQYQEIKYYFDKLLIEYPANHAIYLGKRSTKDVIIAKRMKVNLGDFNNPALLKNSDFTNYVKAYLDYQVANERKKRKYKEEDNQNLSIIWGLIPKYFSELNCIEYWKSNYLYSHIDNDGIKNIGKFYSDFISDCRDTALLNKVRVLYYEDSLGRQGHVINVYKAIGKAKLDIHMFLPERYLEGNKKPVIVYFHGGSWSEGKPDWFFNACEQYAKKGYIACAVEYRTYGRYGTLPFDAVMDAKSAIRWLRKNSSEFNLDTNRIIASGNSAGGHLVLCTALANDWNEKTDDLSFSSIPNVMMVNAGVYDLTDQATSWIRRDLRNKELARQISPRYLVRKNLPPTLLLHGTRDVNVPFDGAKNFVDEMRQAGNNTITFYPLEGAGHFIWIDQKYSPQVSTYRSDFLKKLKYP